MKHWALRPTLNGYQEIDGPTEWSTKLLTLHCNHKSDISTNKAQAIAVLKKQSLRRNRHNKESKSGRWKLKGERMRGEEVESVKSSERAKQQVYTLHEWMREGDTEQDPS